MNYNAIANHYDILIDENNDPIHDPEQLKSYMDKWAGRLAVRVAPLCNDFQKVSFYRQFDVIYSSLTFMHISEKQKEFDRIAYLLACGGRFMLSIYKSQDNFIDIDSSKIKVYPDNPTEIKAYISAAGLELTEQYETEFAHIFVCCKN